MTSGQGQANDQQDADDLRPWWEVAGPAQVGSAADEPVGYGGMGGMMGGMGMGGTAPQQVVSTQEANEAPDGGYYYFRYAQSEDANDSDGEDR